MSKLNWLKVKQPCFIWGKYSEKVRKILTNPDDPRSGYNRVTGNRQALRQLGRFAEMVLAKEDHDAGTKAIAIVGPTSAGKTFTTESHVRNVLGLPFIEVAPEFPSADDLFKTIKRDLERQGLELVKQETDADQPYDYVLPPCGVFIDEAHQIKKALQKGVLLKAIDDADRTLILRDGTKISTIKVHWIVGTTHFYDLFGPLRNRFTVIKLVSHTKSELAEMIAKTNQDLPVEVCQRIAQYCRLPRETKSFVQTLREYKASNGGEWLSLAEEVARDKDIDQGGLTGSQRLVLKALQRGPVGKDTLAALTGLEESELSNDVLPGLMLTTVDMPALIIPTKRGYALTTAGEQACN